MEANQRERAKLTKYADGGTLYDDESDDCEEAYHLPDRRGGRW
jgi:hypothetical protein